MQLSLQKHNNNTNLHRKHITLSYTTQTHPESTLKYYIEATYFRETLKLFKNLFRLIKLQ